MNPTGEKSSLRANAGALGSRGRKTHFKGTRLTPPKYVSLSRSALWSPTIVSRRGGGTGPRSVRRGWGGPLLSPRNDRGTVTREGAQIERWYQNRTQGKFGSIQREVGADCLPQRGRSPCTRREPPGKAASQGHRSKAAQCLYGGQGGEIPLTTV